MPWARIELATFRSSVWRSPNWAIKAILPVGLEPTTSRLLGTRSKPTELWEQVSFLRDSNSRSSVYETDALPLGQGSYTYIILFSLSLFNKKKGSKQLKQGAFLFGFRILSFLFGFNFQGG